ncbi:MAG: alpha/beta fold hydrolase [Myxococcota bacterium]
MSDRETLRVGDFTCLAAGDPEAPVVLCMHGFPDVPATFASLMGALAARGWRVVAPWMRGYAPSTLEGPYHVDRIAEDVVELATALSSDRPVCAIGHDWGAVATYQAASWAPHRFARAVTLAVPHPMTFLRNAIAHPSQLRRSWYMAYFQLPEKPEREIPKDDFAFIDRLWREWSPGWEPPAEHLREVKDCLARSMPAPIEYYRAMFRPVREAKRRMAEAGSKARRIRVETLHLHGAADGCISPEVARGQERFFEGGLVSEVVPDAGHWLHLERPEQVNGRIVDWLAS